jgi:hypothetical protein
MKGRVTREVIYPPNHAKRKTFVVFHFFFAVPKQLLLMIYA